MGLMALHINADGERPIFFYGQAYMGSLEAYLAAPVFRLLGASDFTLRLPLVFLAAMFLIMMYGLTTMLYGRRVALWTLAFLSAGSSEYLARQSQATGGYPELLGFGAAAMVLAAYLSGTSLAAGDRVPIRRQVTYGLWGMVVGLGIWSDPLMLPFGIMSALLLIWTCHRELRGRTLVAPGVGFVLGVAPILAYNLSVPPGQSTIATVLTIMRAGGSGHSSLSPAPLPERIAGMVAVSIPVITGGNGICTLQVQNAWPLSGSISRSTMTCTAVHIAWSFGWLTLWVLGIIRGIRSYRRLRVAHRATPEGRSCNRRESGRQLARLSLLGAASLTVALFMLTSAPAHAP